MRREELFESHDKFNEIETLTNGIKKKKELERGEEFPSSNHNTINFYPTSNYVIMIRKYYNTQNKIFVSCLTSGDPKLHAFIKLNA